MKRILAMAVMAAMMVMAVSINALAGDAGGRIVDVDDDNFKQEVLEADVPVLAVFSASWCKYCRMLEPELEKLAADMKGKVKVALVNTDKSPRYADKYGVQGIPALFMHDKDGNMKKNSVGYMSEEELIKEFGLDKIK